MKFNMKFNIKRYLMVLSFFMLMPSVGFIKAADDKTKQKISAIDIKNIKIENLNTDCKQKESLETTKNNWEKYKSKNKISNFPVKVRVKNKGHEEKILTIPLWEYVLGATIKECSIGVLHEKAVETMIICILSYAIKNRGLDGIYDADNNTFQSFVTLKECNKDFGAEKINILKKLIVDYIDNKKSIPTIDGVPLETLYHTCSGGFTNSNHNVWGGKELPYLTQRISPIKNFMENKKEQEKLIEIYKNAKSAREKQILGNATVFLAMCKENYKRHVKIEIKNAFDKIKNYVNNKRKTSNLNIIDPVMPKDNSTLEDYIKIIEKSKGGYVDRVKAFGVEISGNALKNMFNFRSTCFELKHIKDGYMEFETKGWGHCVGLDQYGLNILAILKKCTPEEAIRFFYEPDKKTGSKIKMKKLSDIKPKYLFKKRF